MEYLIHIAVVASIFSLVALSLDLLVGHLGILSMAQGAFCALGAYVSAVLSTRYGFHFLPVLLVSLLLGFASSLLVCLPAFRLRDEYLVIGTFGFQMIFFTVTKNWITVTRGPMGIPSIPHASIMGIEFDEHWKFLILTGGVLASACEMMKRLTCSPFGRVLHAIREDEVLAASLGKNTFYFRAVAFAISAMFSAVAGSLYAYYATFVDPTTFGINESILALSMVVIGGPGSIRGSVAGATLLVCLPELFRFIGFPDAIAANLRQIAYGAMIVVMMMVRPRGLFGKYDFSQEVQTSS